MFDDQSGYYDTNCTNNGLEDEMRVSNFPLEDFSILHPPPSQPTDEISAMGLSHLDQQMNYNLQHDLQQDQMNYNLEHDLQQQFEEHGQNIQQCYDEEAAAAAAAYAAAPDLLNLLHLPQPFPPASSITFGDGGSSLYGEGSVLYDSSLHLGYAPPGRSSGLDLFNSMPQNHGVFGGVEERGEGAIGGGEFQQGVDYRRKGMKDKLKKGPFVTERHRREQWTEKFMALRSLIPNPTKVDRASIVGDGIEYINELRRTVEELKLLVDQKRRRDRRSMLKMTDHETAVADMESTSMRPLITEDDDHKRSSWVQRRSKDGFVDVRIVDDEVNIKLNQKKKPSSSCLLFDAAKALDDLQLELVHVTGGNIVDHQIFMFNAKICEGSSVYASAIAKKLLEVMEKQYQTLQFSDGF